MEATGRERESAMRMQLPVTNGALTHLHLSCLLVLSSLCLLALHRVLLTPFRPGLQANLVVAICTYIIRSLKFLTTFLRSYLERNISSSIELIKKMFDGGRRKKPFTRALLNDSWHNAYLFFSGIAQPARSSSSRSFRKSDCSTASERSNLNLHLRHMSFAEVPTRRHPV